MAETYAGLQLPCGSWALMVNSETGQPMGDNIAIPIRMIRMYETLVNQDGQERYRPMMDKAVDWLMNNPVRDFHWESQFEDIMPDEGKYKSMSGSLAMETALYLLDHVKEQPEYRETALDIIRYGEDQFVVWSRPMPRPGEAVDTTVWTLPCVLEQYLYYMPIDASAALMIRVYDRAYSVTGTDLYLAKALALGAAATAAQDPATGRMPTLWQESAASDYLQPWLNCTMATIHALLELTQYE
jgi:maltose/maltodextrin transport system substrate-binding protein